MADGRVAAARVKALGGGEVAVDVALVPLVAEALISNFRMCVSCVAPIYGVCVCVDHAHGALAGRAARLAARRLPRRGPGQGARLDAGGTLRWR